MMLDWFPEPLPASGGLSAEGFYKLLGKPDVDPLTVLIRETAQNSWDARLDSNRPVSFEISLNEMEERAKNVLRRVVFSTIHGDSSLRLHEELEIEQLESLIISDRNTKGLGGPLRADQATMESVKDWTNFVLNSGMPKSGAHTGGSYGFGKTITFVASKAQSIVVHTRTIQDGKPQHRLIASTVGPSFEMNDRRFTGRHWWGQLSGDAIFPVLDDEAEHLAASIGMPEFGLDELGTNIMIVAPELGGRSRRQAINYLADAALWNLWPKLVPDSHGRVPMKCGLMLDGQVIPMPRPDEHPPLRHFVDVYRALVHGAEPPMAFKLDKITRHSKLVGQLGSAAFAWEARAARNDGSSSEGGASGSPNGDEDLRSASPFGNGASQHVALLRTPELVVKYVEGPPATDSALEWAGVFRASDEFDHVFSNAEPSTHDAWNAAGMADREERNVVRKALTDIRKRLEERWLPNVKSETSTDSTAVIADRLSHLVLGSNGAGRGLAEPSRASGASRLGRHPHFELIEAQVDIQDGVYVSRAEFRLFPGSVSGRILLEAEVGVALGETDFDTELDPTMSISRLSIDGEELTVRGRHVREYLVPSHPTSVIFEAVNSGEYTVMWSVDARVES